MANWYGSARSNYFKVKDEAAFVAWAESMDLEIIRNDDGLVGLLPGDTEDGDWPQQWYDADDNELDDPLDVPTGLRPHLADGQVAFLFTVGAEKLRYLTACMTVVTPEAIHYHGFENMMRELYPTATRCEY